MSSLFPAYCKTTDDADRSIDTKSAPNKDDSDWLKNSSFVCADDGKLQNLNYGYLSRKSEENVNIGEESYRKEQKRHYVTEYDSTESEGDLLTDKQGSPSKKDKKESGSFSENDDQDKTHHHIKYKKKKNKNKKLKHVEKREESSTVRAQDEKASDKSYTLKQEKRIFLEDFEQNLPNCYHHLDKSSDKNNYTYQSIYKGHLARYRCLRNVGLGISMADLMKDTTKRKKRHKPERYFDSKQSKQMREDATDIILLEPVLCNEENANSRRDAPVLQDFMSLCEKAEEHITNSQVREESSCHSEAVALPKSAVFKKQEEYNQKLTQNPCNISLWLEFINFQDHCSHSADGISLCQTELGLKKHKKNEALILQTKEAIFERALKENPYSTELKMAQLECFRDYWDFETLQTEWRQLVMRNKSNTKVWQKYLSYMESKASSFTVTNLIKAYKKCLVSLKSSVTDFLIDIFCQLCCRLGQSGHAEKATALFQAQLEYNLFAPREEMGISATDMMEYFQAFWESTAPRLGENGSMGWNHWMENHGNVELFKPFLTKDEDETLELEILKAHNDKHTIWLTMETLRTSRHWLAWRPEGSNSYDDCEDMERLVVSDDVTFALFTVNKPLQKLKLLSHFLNFLGVPSEKHYSISCQVSVHDEEAPVKLETLSGVFRRQSHVSSGLNLAEKCIIYTDRHKFIENIFTQTLNLFTDSCMICNTMVMMYVDFLEQSVFSGQTTWSPKQLKAKGKEIRTAMKNLLYEEPFRYNVLAWLRYALILWRLGKLDDARKALYHILTSLVSSQDEALTKHCTRSIKYLLYRTYSEMEFGLIPHSSLVVGHDGRSNDVSGQKRALQVLASICSEEFTMPSEVFTLTTSQLIRCKKHYSDVQTELIERIKERELQTEEDCYMVDTFGSSLEHWAICYEMFVYITHGLHAAKEVYQEVSGSIEAVLKQTEQKNNKQFDVISGIKQRLTQSHILLLKFHIKQECSPLRTVRIPLLAALEMYPDNADLLWAYIRLELAGALTGDLRRRLTQICSKTATSLVWTMSLVAQLQRLAKLKAAAVESELIKVPEAQMVLPEAGYINTVRNWFRWALSTHVCSHYLLLWRLYLRFEIQQGKSDSAKKTFYEAIQHCPWAKCLYMDFVEAFPDSTQEVVDLMTEREIRVHVPLEEIDILLEDAQSE